MTPEFSRREAVATIGDRARTVTVEADPHERAALAERFGLVAIDRLAARFELRRDGEVVAATGVVEGAAVQACTVTGEPISVAIAETVDLRFVTASEDGEDLEIDADALDTLPIEAGGVDLGEAAAETLALALDPYPRGPGAAAALAKAGVVSEDDVRPASPFAALKGLGGR